MIQKINKALELIDSKDRTPKKQVRPLLYEAIHEAEMIERNLKNQDNRMKKIFDLIGKYQDSNSGYHIDQLLEDLKIERRMYIEARELLR